MHATSWVVAAGLALGIAAKAAAAVTPAATTAVAQRDVLPHRLAFLDAPPPAPPAFPPSPGREPDEYPRRNWELVPAAGAGTPFCRGGGFGASSCAQSGAGAAFALSALYRLSPYVALGTSLGLASFRLDGSGTASAYSRANWLGLLVRGYFAERGSIDPYVEAGFGRGAVESGDAGVRMTGAGPSAMAGAGVDFWVLPYLRLGPALSYRWTWLSGVEMCQATACAAASLAERGVVGSYASLSLVATLALGSEM
jgi:hypothetical protein